MEMNPFGKADFELLFKTHFKGLTLFAIRYVKDVEVAKEMVQDSFVTLWEKRETMDTSQSVKSYLTTIIYNRCLNYLRDHKKFNREILETEHLLEQPDQQKPDDMLASNELERKINETLDKLPEKCKEIFILSRYENLKYHEISAKLNIAVKTVEAQMSKALKIMREELKEFITVLLLIFLLK